jgi:hypothetical protein
MGVAAELDRGTSSIARNSPWGEFSLQPWRTGTGREADKGKMRIPDHVVHELIAFSIREHRRHFPSRLVQGHYWA